MILSCARPNWCEVVLLSQPHFKRKWMSCSARCDQDSSLIVLYCTLVRKLAFFFQRTGWRYPICQILMEQSDERRRYPTAVQQSDLRMWNFSKTPGFVAGAAWGFVVTKMPLSEGMLVTNFDASLSCESKWTSQANQAVFSCFWRPWDSLQLALWSHAGSHYHAVGCSLARSSCLAKCPSSRLLAPPRSANMSRWRKLRIRL